MKKILLGAVGALSLGVVTTAVLIHSGAYNFAADVPHAPIVHRLIEWAREHSIQRQLADIVPPANLSDPERIRRGAGNYEAMCAGCHLAPGAGDTEIRKGLYPAPPNFSEGTGNADFAMNIRRFWIIKHGIKATSMPAWSKGGMDDETIWDLVAFLKIVPNLSPEEYRRQVEASDGHSHGGQSGHAVSDEKKTDQGISHDATPHGH